MGTRTGLLTLDAYSSRLRPPRLSERSASTLLHRRRFLGAMVEAVAGVALTGWSSAVRAASGQPASGTGAFALIHTHTHFYDPTRAQNTMRTFNVEAGKSVKSEAKKVFWKSTG